MDLSLTDRRDQAIPLCVMACAAYVFFYAVFNLRNLLYIIQVPYCTLSSRESRKNPL